MKKHYVLDTNILMQTEGKAVKGFDDNIVVITYTTLEELDGLKKAPAEKGYSARESLKIISEIIENKNKINENGGELLLLGLSYEEELRIKDEQTDFPVEYNVSKPDNRILYITLNLSKGTDQVYLITNDGLMKTKAHNLGINVQGYRNDQVTTPFEYEGREKITHKERLQAIGLSNVNKQLLDENNKEGIITLDKETVWACENQYFEIEDDYGYTLSKYRDGKLHLLRSNGSEDVYGISPKNPGQRFCIDALIAPANEVPLVIIKGPAGCGKTMLAMAAGLEKIYSSNEYNKIIITRSNTLSDEEVGFLPGNLFEKTVPLASPFFDNLSFLFRNKFPDMKAQDVADQIDDLLENRLLEIVSMAYIRGRSIAKSFIVIDEAQNLTVTQAKTIVTRAGTGSKIILMGDLGQIDNNKLDKKNNGLAYISEKFTGSPLCAQITFEENECVRSELALDAVNRLC